MRARSGSTVATRTSGRPRDAIDLGIGMVHQHLLQVSSYSVVENVVLGTSGRSGGLRKAARRIEELSERFGLAVDPRARTDRLSVGARQRVEILKVLYRGARILILDEPTTNLTPQEVDDLFTSLRVSSPRAPASCSSRTRCARCSRSATASPSCATVAA